MITPGFSLTATERVLPKLALDFTTASLDPRITFTRALNTATVINSSGVIVGVNANLPRFDYTLGTGGACKGLLIEEARTNYVQGSENIQSGLWSTNGTATATSVTELSPANTNTASLLTGITGTTFPTNTLWQTITGLTGGATYTFTLYVKAGTATTVSIGIRDGYTGSISTQAIALTASYQRVTVTRTLNALATSIAAMIYSADGTVYAWGGQVELGAFATSYIPNLATGTTTRNADSPIITGSNFTSFFNATQGTLFVSLPKATPSTSLAIAATIADDLGSIYIRQTTPTTVSCAIDGVFFGTQTLTTPGYKAALGYQVGTCGFSLNGAAAFTANVSTLSSNSTNLTIGGGGGGGQKINCAVAKVFYYNVRLTNAELQAITY